MTFLNFTFQDSSPLIEYSPEGWGEGSPTADPFAANYSGGSFKVASGAAATATLTFEGTSITLYGAKRPNHGNYSVMLDDEPAFVGNGNGNNIFQFPLWNAQDLSNSQHNVIITNLPIGNNQDFDVDFFSIGREIGPPGYNGPIFNVTIDDESPFVVYNSSESWSSLFSASASNTSLHRTSTEGASVSLFFQGSSVELYGLYVNAPFQVNLDNQLPRLLAGLNMSLENTMYEHPQTLLYYADGLDESQTHVVTLTNTVGDPGRPFYFDFAVVQSSQAFFGDTPSPNSGFAVPTSTSVSASASVSKVTAVTPATTNHAVAQSRSHSTPVGAIVGGVVGGVGGLLILAIFGFILFRRRRYHQPASSRLTEEGTAPIRQTRNGVTPFIIPPQPPSSHSTSSYSKRSETSRNLATIDRDSTTQPIHSPPVSTVSGSGSGFRSSRTTSQDQLTVNTESAPYTAQILGGPSNQSHGNTLITETYILQESDVGRLVQTSRLPPMYNADWDDTSGFS